MKNSIFNLPKRKAEFIEPMECAPVTKLHDGPGWFYEIKLDGYRAIAVKSGRVNLFSRRRKLFNTQYPDLVEALAELPEGTVVDGEVVALDDSGRPNFNLLAQFRSGASRIHYFIFDLHGCNDRDLTKLPLSERRALVKSLLKFRSPRPLGCSRRAEEKVRTYPAKHLETVSAAGRLGLGGSTGLSALQHGTHVTHGEGLVGPFAADHGDEMVEVNNAVVLNVDQRLHDFVHVVVTVIHKRFVEVREGSTDIAEVDFVDLFPRAEVPDGACGVDADVFAALGPGSAAEAHGDVGAAGDLEGLLAVVEGGEDARDAKERGDGRVVGMEADDDAFLFGDGNDLFEEVGQVGPDFVA